MTRPSQAEIDALTAPLDIEPEDADGMADRLERELAEKGMAP